MRAKLIALVLASLLSVPAAAEAQASFEGTVTYKVATQIMTMDMTHHVRGNQIRQEVNGAMGSMVVIMDAESAVMIMPAQKTYMKLDIGGLARQAAEAAAQAPRYEIVATGRSETIAGHSCEHYTIKQDDSEIDVCAATGLGFHMGGGMQSPGAGGRSPMSGWSDGLSAELRQRFENGFFPLKMTMQQGGVSMEVTHLERKKLSDELFEIPADFTEMKMPGG